MAEKRQLAAIMFTDIVGYSSLMGKDESAAYQLLKRNRGVQKPLIEKHGGKWLKEMGDGVLASFQTISDAVYCAIDIQRACKEDSNLKLRIGIHLGEVIVEDGDVFGDGVNIASRIEPLAPAGGIYVSESVYRNIKNRQGIITGFVREENLKNVDHPVKIYQVEVDASELPIKLADDFHARAAEKPGAYKKIIATLGLGLLVVIIGYFTYHQINKVSPSTELISTEEIGKSIAVLPFEDMSPHMDQQYFSDGMMEEILNHLYKLGDIDVTSRTSSMRYKDSALSIPDIAKELGVATILEGSVRKDGDKIRITVQLIDGKTDKHLWSETYDREFIDVFQIQSEVAQQVATVLKAKINPDIKERMESIPTTNMEAYSLLLESRYTNNPDSLDILIDMALELDPEYGAAYVLKAMNRLNNIIFTRIAIPEDLNTYLAEIIDLFKKGLRFDPNNADAYTWMGSLYLWFEWDFMKAEENYLTANSLNPGLRYSAYTEFLLSIGKFTEAIKNTERIIKANPSEDEPYLLQGLCYSFIGQNDEVNKFIRIANEKFNAATDDADGLSFIYYPLLSRVLIYIENYPEVLTILEPYMNDIISPRLLSYAAIAYYHTGQYAKANEITKKLIAMSNESEIGSPAFYLATIYSQKEEIDLAFEWLEKSYEEHEVEMYWLKVEPPFEPLRSDPRYQEMLDKVGFPD